MFPKSCHSPQRLINGPKTSRETKMSLQSFSMMLNSGLLVRSRPPNKKVPEMPRRVR